MVLGTDGRSGGPQQRGLAGPYAAGDPRWPVWREFVSEEADGAVSGSVVRTGQAGHAIVPGRG